MGVKGVRQSMVITNNPSSIDPNQQLPVRLPNLGKDDVIIPGTAKLAIKISGNEVMSIDGSDVFHCYNDLWKAAPERANGHYQGIDAYDKET